MTRLKELINIGAIGRIEHIYSRRLVVGSRGMFVFDDTQPVEEKLVLYPHVINWKDGMPVPEKAEGTAIDISDIWDEPLKAECRAFLSAMETGDKPITSGEEGLRAMMAGNPGRRIGSACQCGERLSEDLKCLECGAHYENGPDGGIVKQ